jgi:hypothetical protein
MVTPTFHRLPGPDEAAEPTEDEPVYEQRERDPDPGPHHPPSLAPSGLRKFDSPSERPDSNPVLSRTPGVSVEAATDGDTHPARCVLENEERRQGGRRGVPFWRNRDTDPR